MTPILRAGAALFAVVSALSFTACGGGGDPTSTQRKTSFGEVEGLDLSATSGTYAWLVIPYA